MAKIRNPLLSFEAHGTLADNLTFQRQVKTARLRKKPIPHYRNTLLQQYQRWLYKDALFAWKEQTDAQIKGWRAYGSRHHMPAMAAFIRYYLSYLPDIMGMWHLDDLTGGVTLDYSKNLNHGTVTGTSPVKGVIDQAAFFDGLTDYIEFPAATSNDVRSDFTLECSFAPFSMTMTGPVIRKYETPGKNLYGFYVGVAPTIEAQVRDTGANLISATTNYTSTELAHLAMTFDHSAKTVKIFTAGIYRAQDTNPAFTTVMTPTIPLRLARQTVNYGKCTIDHIILWDRILADAQILDHSLRRYPS